MLFNGLNEQDRDIHFSAEFARAHELNNQVKVLLAVHGSDDRYVMLPFQVRDIRKLPFVTAASFSAAYYDISSLYSFGGPIARTGKSRSGERNLYLEFQRAFSDYCKGMNIVTQFTAFHPLLSNHRYLQDTGLVELRRRKPVVWVDLCQDVNSIFADLAPNHRHAVRKAQSLGVEANPEEWTPEAVATFNDLYRANMERVGANERWFLPSDFCNNCHHTMGPNRISLFNATRAGEVLASALILRCEMTAYYHFVGSREEAYDCFAHPLLIFEIAKWAKALGCRRLHLGGGLSENDGIFRFKSRFSPCRAWLYTGSSVYDDATFRRLCEARASWDQERGIFYEDADFFPPYRQ